MNSDLAVVPSPPKLTMPLYEIQHHLPLTREQRDDLAQSITALHTQKFSTPSFFISILFTDVANSSMYVAGKPVSPC